MKSHPSGPVAVLFLNDVFQCNVACAQIVKLDFKLEPGFRMQIISFEMFCVFVFNLDRLVSWVL